MIAPDETTFEYLKGRANAPSGDAWEAAVADWSTLHSDDDAEWDKQVVLDAAAIRPHVTWGTNPGQVAPIDRSCPSPDDFDNPTTQESVARALEYMGLEAGHTAARRRGRHGVHRVVHQQPDRGSSCCGRGDEGPHGHRAAGDGRARKPRREGAGDRRRTRPGVHRRGRRLARAGLFDVPGDEPRQARPGRACGEHEQSELRGPPGPRRTHPSRLARGRRGHRGQGDVLYACRPGRERRHEGRARHHRNRGTAEALRRRHRPDHPRRLAQARRANRFREGLVRHLARRPRTSSSTTSAMRRPTSSWPARRSASDRHASTPCGRSSSTASTP